MIPAADLQKAISDNVRQALTEDVGSGDITASLIPAGTRGHARIITRDPMILAGRPWVDALFQTLDPSVTLDWHADEGAALAAGATLLELDGPARSLLTGERAALNFLQTLSGTATRTHQHVQLLAGTGTRLLDTRKTIPGLRLAQKYAVGIGGGQNHRLGLFDAFLIKENHIMAAGGIREAVEQAHRIAPGRPVEIEVESLAELELAIGAGADIVMLDNFDLATMATAVQLTAGRARLEASGGVNQDTLRPIAETGVDYVSLGTLTKDLTAIDLSMRFVQG
jgi:nicotinate-nucleotide pyrophosphorylase (carboxylating)